MKKIFLLVIVTCFFCCCAQAQLRGIYDMKDSTKYRARFDRAGQDSCLFGYFVASGDINGDGFKDMVFGTYGGWNCYVYVVYGSGSLKGGKSMANTLNFDVRFDGLVGGRIDPLGNSVACGDVNKDGYDDIVISSSANSSNSRSASGSVYVVYGSPTLRGIKNLDSSYNIRFDGEQKENFLGNSVACGDFNGDGYKDIVMLKDYGSVYVVYGSPSLSGIKDLKDSTSYNIRFDGKQTSAAPYMLGASGLAFGDVNHDGKQDLLLTTGDSVYLIYGRDSFNTKNVDISNGKYVDARFFGQSVGLGKIACGDIDGDGRDDILLGAPGTGRPTFGQYKTGSVFVVKGSNVQPGAGQSSFNMSNPSDYSIRFDGPDSAARGIGSQGMGVWDVNGDKIGDCVISCWVFKGSTSGFQGEVYATYGSSSLTGVQDYRKTSSYQARVDGRSITGDVTDILGTAMAGGDIDKDGYEDLILGDPSIHNPSPSGPQGSVFYVNSKDSGATINIRDEHPPIAQLELSQAYPNPLTNEGRVSINYLLSTPASVSVRVSDTFGRKILEEKSEIEQGGSHSFSFDASTLKAGVYFYTVDTRSGAKSGKFVVTK